MRQSLNASKTVYYNDFVMVRVDKTLKEMMEEKPSSRWDVEYWHPRWESLSEVALPLTNFSQFIQDDGITYGQVGERVFSKKGKIQYLQVINLKPTGIVLSVRDDRVEENSRNDPERSRLKPGQILLTRTSFPGMDTLIGRCVVVPDTIGKANVSEDIDVISLKEGISPEAICIFIKSEFGQNQIHRKKKGVKSVKINFDEIRSIKIPIFSKAFQSHIETEYKKMAVCHDKAMEAKAEGNEAKYKKNIETAEAMLKDLIAKTEAVIRGEREDVV